MARGTIKIHYKIRVTVRVSVRYSVRIMTAARYVVAQARSRGSSLSHDELIETARAILPAGTDDGELRDAIDAVCDEPVKEEWP